MRVLAGCAVLVCAVAALGQQGTPAKFSPEVQQYVRYDSGKNAIYLDHVRVIDGTGAAPLEDVTVLISRGKIVKVGAAADVYCVDCPAGLHVDMTGHTVFPGLVGMHDHMYYIARPNLDAGGHSDPPLVIPQMTFTSPHLYLGAGVTTLRTTGSVEPYTDLNLRREIDAGQLPGPHMDVTAPYLEGPHSPFIQMHQLRDEADARATVRFWAAQGATSFKAYMNITRAELGAAIDEAHKLGLKLTGHLCSVTYPEAVALGIDDLEHGFFVNTQLDPGKQEDVCPATVGGPTLASMKAGSPEAAALIKLMVDHHVALTSTLPVFESSDPKNLHVEARTLEMMSPAAREAYMITRNLELMRQASTAAMISPAAGAKTRGDNGTSPLRDARPGAGTSPALPPIDRAANFRNGMALEREFAAAGGLLLAGPDPTGDGGVLPGFGDQREVELLVEAGFTPLEAIRIATRNGAEYLGRLDQIGTVAEGKNADLVVVAGNPAKDIGDIEKVAIVFKDGVGYDAGKLIDSARGRYGQY